MAMYSMEMALGLSREYKKMVLAKFGANHIRLALYVYAYKKCMLCEPRLFSDSSELDSMIRNICYNKEYSGGHPECLP